MPDRAALWDKDQDGLIALAEVPQQYRLVVGRGDFSLFNRLNGVVLASPNGVPRPTAPIANPGPMWFQRMDRNADGDVSGKEFLGRLKDFQKLDQNQDGLISPEEANRA
jgi:Ca2+-binding EF-hand superfamily protein